MSKSNRYDRSRSLFAIVRVDFFQLREEIPDDPTVFVAVKEIVEDEEQAAREVERLNGINSAKDVRYFSYPARVLPPES